MLIAHVLRLTKWEWFKLQRRWMPWILLAIAVLLSQLGFWANYAAYHNDTVQEVLGGSFNTYGQSWEEEGRIIAVDVSCADIANDRMPPEFNQLTEEQQRDFRKRVDEWYEGGACESTQPADEFRKGFTLPDSITGTIGGFSSIGPLLIMILAASVMGSEYGWGTLRNVLTRGTGRWQLLSAKLLLLLRLCSDVLIILAVFAVVSSLIATVIPPDETGGLADSGKWLDIVTEYLKIVYSLVPFIALSVFLTVLTSSTAVGVAVSIGYYFVESIVSPLLKLNDTLANVTDYLLIASVNTWTAVSFVQVEVSSGGAPVERTSDALQAFLVIFVYTAALLAAAFWLFMRRDIAGARGD